MSDEQKTRWDAYYAEANKEYQSVKHDAKALLEWKYRRYMHEYLGTIHSLDRNIGRVLDYLDEAGLAENTIVVYASDQGFFIGEHGWFDKRYMYEESMRTPLIIRYPAAIEPGHTETEMVQNIYDDPQHEEIRQELHEKLQELRTRYDDSSGEE